MELVMSPCAGATDCVNPAVPGRLGPAPLPAPPGAASWPCWSAAGVVKIPGARTPAPFPDSPIVSPYPLYEHHPNLRGFLTQ